MLAKRLYRAMVGPPVDDLVRAWPGTAAAGLRPIRHLHIGDCNFRRMDFAHDTQAGPGYPLAAAEVLRMHGIGVEFAHYFAVNFDYLPDRERLQRVVKLSAAPDVITVQLGGNYTRWIVIPDTARMMQMRVEVGRRLGRRTFFGYKAMNPFLAAFGRPAAIYPGIEPYDRFLDMLHDIWPQAQIVLVPPFPRCLETRRQRPIAERVMADIRELAERRDLPLVNTTALLGKDPHLRGATGYNLNGRGSELIGKELARIILAQQRARSRGWLHALAAAALRV
jgi:GDSL-like Lipase/Acylhydrolase family